MALPDFAVVVGIQAYQHFGPGKTAAPLQAPIRNATAVRDWLVGRGGVNDCALIVDSTDSSGNVTEPTKAKIEGALHRLASLAEEQNDRSLGSLIGRRLYLYMSGHGWSPGVQQSCLFAADASLQQTWNVHATGWLRWFQDAAYFREFVLWMDCCMDRFSSFPPGSVDKPAVPGRLTPGPTFVAFAAPRPLKAAEVLNPTNQLPDGVFTWALLDGLEGAAADVNGRVTGRSLADWLRQSILARLPQAAQRDFDIAKETEIINESSELIFAREVAPKRFRVRLAANPMPNTGEIAIFAGSPLRKECRVATTGDPVELELAPGLYHAEHDLDDLAANFEVVCDRDVPLAGGIPKLQIATRDALYVLDFDPPDAAVEITVVDHRFAAVERGIGRLRTRLPAGLFKLRARSGRNIEDTVLLLDRDMGALQTEITAPARATVAPIDGTLSSHEYQAGALHEFLIRGDEERGKAQHETSAVSLLVRTFSDNGDASATLEPWNKVAIFDQSGTPVVIAGEVRDAPGHDPFAVAVKAVPPGHYLLRHILDSIDGTAETANGTEVQQSLIIPRGWSLEVHVLRRVIEGAIDCRPRISLHMAKNGQAVTDDERRLVEIARLALADERPIIGDELQELLVRKFANPIAGILGGHLLLVGEEAGQIFDSGLLNDVVRNLRGLVGDEHPDVEALSLRCTNIHLRTKQTRISMAPMFERSWRMLVEASYDQPRLLSDKLVARLLAPSALPPFLVWTEDRATRSGALRQLYDAVWGPRSLGDATVGTGPPPLGQPITAAAAAMSMAASASIWASAAASGLSRTDRRDRRLARDRATSFNLPSNAFRRLLDREEPGP